MKQRPVNAPKKQEGHPRANADGLQPKVKPKMLTNNSSSRAASQERGLILIGTERLDYPDYCNLSVLERFFALAKALKGDDDEYALDMISYNIAACPGSGHHAECFWSMASMMKPHIFWIALHRHWPFFNWYIPHRKFAGEFRDKRASWRPEYMGPENAGAYAALPKTLTVYRGQSADKPAGLSWTLERRIAENFASEVGMDSLNPVVIEATVSKRDVAGHYPGEAEVLLFSSGAARKRTVTAWRLGAERRAEIYAARKRKAAGEAA